LAQNVIGQILMKYPTEMNVKIKEYAKHNNLWMRRTSILVQLKFKAQTNEELLKYCLIETMNENEFFIQKAIGWALREYSKSNPEFTKEFIQIHENKLSNLAIREGIKYVK
jgi:3-methyladenine DNA glycosylase AlkD